MRAIAARNDLIERHLPLVKRIAKRIWQGLPKSVQLDDLVQAGVFGLMDAIEGFDPARRNRFTTYCAPRIRGAIRDHLREMDWVPRLVRARREKAVELVDLRFAFGAPDRRLRDPSDDAPDRRLERKDLMRLITKGLSKSDRLIVLLYYYEDQSMKRIGETLGVNESRVSQKHSMILEHLRRRLAGRRAEWE